MSKIFISYSHKDEEWLDYVRSHLRTAEELDLWDDRKLMGGDDWEAEIKAALAACDVCILLVSRHVGLHRPSRDEDRAGARKKPRRAHLSDLRFLDLCAEELTG